MGRPALFNKLLLISSALVSAIASPQTRPSGTGARSACARVQNAIDQQPIVDGDDSKPLVPASLVLRCLQSVPNEQEPAQELVKSLKAFVGWQSSLAWLKDPPDSYSLPATDVEKRLDDIAGTVAANGFSSEYDFQLSLRLALASAHDGHFNFAGDIFKPIVFQSELTADLVSISSNGTEIPQLYHLGNPGSAAITQINGVDADNFLTDFGLNFDFAGFQDTDTQWNSHFTTTSDSTSPLANFIAFQSPTLEITYADGTARTEDIPVLVDRTFSDIGTGQDYYNTYCVPKSQSQPETSAQTTRTGKARLRTRSPSLTPIVTNELEDRKESIAGYFLSGGNYEDAAVLSISDFESETNKDLADFQGTVESFLAMSREAGKSKLVIDLTGNVGGSIVLGHDLFGQLFPDVAHFTANNIRQTDSLQDVLRLFNTGNSAQLSEEQLDVVRFSTNSLASGFATPDGVQNPSGEQFTTLDALTAPVDLHGDQFTPYQQTSLTAVPNFSVTGFGNRQDPPPAVFSPENVVLLTDGACSSTCTTFSYLMINLLGIKTVTVGGRPQPGPVQSIGGVEGAETWTFKQLQAATDAAISSAPAEEQADLRAREIGVLAEGYVIQRASNPQRGGGLNLKNSFAPFDSQTPLQFLDQSANCRFFYTAEMLLRTEVKWEYAVDATWTDPDFYCVPGSRVQVTPPQPLDPAFQSTKAATGTDETDGNNRPAEGTGSNSRPADEGGKDAADGEGLGSLGSVVQIEHTLAMLFVTLSIFLIYA